MFGFSASFRLLGFAELPFSSGPSRPMANAIAASSGPPVAALGTTEEVIFCSASHEKQASDV